MLSALILAASLAGQYRPVFDPFAPTDPRVLASVRDANTKWGDAYRAGAAQAPRFPRADIRPAPPAARPDWAPLPPITSSVPTRRGPSYVIRPGVWSPLPYGQVLRASPYP